MKRAIIPIMLSFVLVTMMSASDQILKTQLRITVIDDLGNIQEGATVQLFTSEKDFKEEKNAISGETATTNAKGIIVFKNLKPMAYYVLATKGDKNNWNGGQKTDPLKENKVNRVNIVIE